MTQPANTVQQDQIDQIMERLDKLYRDIPLEYCGYVLTAIQDIEVILYKDRQKVLDFNSR